MVAALERRAPVYAWAEPRGQSAIRPGKFIDLLVAPVTLDIDGNPHAVVAQAHGPDPFDWLHLHVPGERALAGHEHT